MDWLSGYEYRKKGSVVATAAGAQTNYQMQLLVGESSGAVGEDVDCHGNCQDFPNDIRFTAADGQTKHDYWVESLSGVTPNRLARIWIEVASIPASGSVDFCMYYGKTSDSGESNGSNTFEFFDDFSASLDWTNKWQSNNQGLYSVSGGNLVLLNGGFTYSNCLNSKNSFSGGYAFEARQKAAGLTPCELYFASEGSVATKTTKEQTSIRIDDSFVAYIGGSYSHSGTCVLGTWYRSKLKIPASGTAGAYIYSDDGQTLYESLIGTPTYRTGYIFIHQRPNNAGYVDWVFVRKYVSPESTWGTWSSEGTGAIARSYAFIIG